MSKTTALHVLRAFSTFLGHPLHEYNVKPSFFGGRGHTMRNFAFLKKKSLGIQLQEKSPGFEDGN